MPPFPPPLAGEVASEASRRGQVFDACASVEAASPLPALPRKRGRESCVSRRHRARQAGNHLFEIVERVEARLGGDMRRHDDVGKA